MQEKSVLESGRGNEFRSVAGYGSKVTGLIKEKLRDAAQRSYGDAGEQLRTWH
jgi:hypothetical protein